MVESEQDREGYVIVHVRITSGVAVFRVNDYIVFSGFDDSRFNTIAYLMHD